ncbi:hypothetical protein QYE76_046495 [Lolium multiflorum]|uniref:Reverse transcriptase domain-containing protein n=1 Tax=Lolium multiflorum TaxID=4521 RepID=A0AAD8TPW2_LOLMU|nr:hypothetical protein QYE76_046495 [Lolium multiflorum]
MGFGERFLQWIALLLYPANTKVTVNGVPGARIHHARGLRQGDPTSPMMFLIDMEVLTKIIEKVVEAQLFSNLAGISPIQRLSVYADDVVVFLKPEVQELRALHEILRIFGEASGLHVNNRKTTATLIRGSIEAGERVKEVLDCELANFPTWQHGMIARAGRLVLIKAVISARPFEVDLPHLAYTLEEWWLRAGREVQKSDRRRFDSLVTLVAWTLWKQRNARVFGNVRLQLNTEQIIDSPLVWDAGSRASNVFAQAPMDVCDDYAKCNVNTASTLFCSQ